jgi:hypothetical protein
MFRNVKFFTSEKFFLKVWGGGGIDGTACAWNSFLGASAV